MFEKKMTEEEKKILQKEAKKAKKAENLKKDVVVARVDADAVVSVYASSLGELPRDGFYVKEDLVKGQMLHKEDIEESDFVMDKYKEDAVITSLKVSEFSNSVCDSIRYGDIVDVYAVDPAPDELVFVVVNVYILGAYNSSGEKLNTAEGSAVAFTVLATPEEVV